jgi:hypothetical protein
LPRGAAILLAVSGPLAGILYRLLPGQLDQLTAIPTGMALVWLGFALLFERRVTAAGPNPGEAKFDTVQPEPGKVA